jgi:hypothetical protein
LVSGHRHLPDAPFKHSSTFVHQNFHHGRCCRSLKST